MEMLIEIGSKDKIPEFLQQVKHKQAILMGFGHRVFKAYDPRAKMIKEMIFDLQAKLGVSDPLVDIAVELEKQALADEYFQSRKLYPNIDYYSGLLLKILQIPKKMFNVIFGVARSIGWLVHW